MTIAFIDSMAPTVANAQPPPPVKTSAQAIVSSKKKKGKKNEKNYELMSVTDTYHTSLGP